MNWLRCLSRVALLALLAAPAAAQDWTDYGPRDRYEALQNYREHRRLPKKDRRQIERQYDRWREMPEEDRDRIRRNYRRLQRMPPEEQRRFERRYERWKDQQGD